MTMLEKYKRKGAMEAHLSLYSLP